MRDSIVPTPRGVNARLLIVNADDFGLSVGVNRGVLTAHREGLVTSTSLMANLPAAADAVERWRTMPALGLGLHLNLTAGPPLSPPEQVSSLARQDGRFRILGEQAARLSAGQARPAELERELRAQIERALHLGCELDHLDSHHHLHIHPRLAPLVIRLAREYRLPAVRAPAEGLQPLRYQRAGPRDLARSAAISTLGWLFGLRARRAGLRTARHFRGIAMGLGFATPTLLRELRHLPPGLTELMVHPGYLDQEQARYTDFSANRDRELEALTSPAARGILEQIGALPVTWKRALAAS